ncbi:MAG: DUF366 family protein [Cyanobacteria bacterium P01_H01_bin.74]
MKYQFIDDEIPYTGKELSSHWAYRSFGMLGDSVIGFIGPCHVNLTDMVDLEDVLNNDYIYSKKMLHFIIEIFNISLQEGILLQRLFSSVIQDRLCSLVLESAGISDSAKNNAAIVKRYGDDLFVNNTAKLSVSICTQSPTSVLIHTGLNIDPEGTPVEASGLSTELGLSGAAIKTMALACMRALSEEWRDIGLACCKVRAVV